MERKTTSAITRWIIAVLGISNIFSFVLGVALAGVGTQRGTDLAARLGGALSAARSQARPVSASAREAQREALERKDERAVTAAASIENTPIHGKGMWIYEFNKIHGGNPDRIVRAAVGQGLTHIYVRLGSSKVGANGWKNIRAILPVAHAHGLKVIAWDFPYLRKPGGDVRRARFAMNHTVKGHRIDGFAADIETRAEGTLLTRTRARKYATWLRNGNPTMFRILVPPRPNPHTVKFYPYATLMPYFDAVAPMVYWGRQHAADATDWAVRYLRQFGKPIAPIGQAYDMGPEGGPKGHPKGRALVAFMNHARKQGSVGVSFWSWQHTPRGLWHTIRTYQWPGAKKLAG